MDLATIQPFINYLILLLIVSLNIWIIADSVRRYTNKWIMSLISIIISFVPFVLYYLINKSSPNYYLLLTGLFIWIIYLLIKPPYTLEEMQIIERDQRLKELRKMYYEYELSKSGRICPVCGLPVETDYIICPNCYKRLKEKCEQCGRLIDINWNMCPYCGRKVARKKEDEISNF